MSYHKLAQSIEDGRDTLSSEIDADEKQTFLGSASGAQRRRPPGGFRLYSVATALNLMVLGLSATLFCITMYKEHFVLNAALRRVSTYSPLHALIDLESHPELVNGTLFQPKYPSLARLQPNAEADAIWDELELTRVFPATRADIIRLGKDPETATKLEDEIWGLGDDAYATIFDMYHQLHCLNSLRQIAYGHYYNMSMVHADRQKLPELHVNHCIDILMQAIQCSGNLNLITLHWMETQEYPFPDMSVNRQCINFDKLTDWRLENTIDMKKYIEVMKKPAGVKEEKMAADYFKLFNVGEDAWHPHEHGGHGEGDSRV